MEQYEQLIAELSDLVGIIPEYYDIFGTKHVTSKDSRKAILSAMGLCVGTSEEISREITRTRTRQWHAVLDPVTIISVHSQPYNLPVHLPLPEGKEQGAEITLTLEDEQGKSAALHFPAGTLQVNEQRSIEGRRFVRFLLPLPQKELGYYRVTATCRHREPVFGEGASSLERSGRLIVTPDSCYLPEQLHTGRPGAWP